MPDRTDVLVEVESPPEAPSTPETPAPVPAADTGCGNGPARRWDALTAARDAGMTTAEYAVGTVAAAGFAAVLLKVVQSGAVRDALAAVVQRALSVL